MIPIKKALSTSIGKKYVMAVTGLALVGFIIMHLLGNLYLYNPDPGPFNAYAKALHDWGNYLYVAEFGLLAVFAIHAAFAMWIHFNDKPRSRPEGYMEELHSKGGNSRFNISSVNMIITGLVLLTFLVIHLIQFRFGPGVAQGYATVVHGETTRDLYRSVAETLSQWPWALFYMGVMLFLGLHLRHGFWSMLQSLGAMKPEWSRGIYTIGLIFAAVISIGFFFIPLWFALDIPGRL